MGSVVAFRNAVTVNFEVAVRGGETFFTLFPARFGQRLHGCECAACAFLGSVLRCTREFRFPVVGHEEAAIFL